VPAERAITIQDIFCHTAGLTYEFLGSGPVPRAYFTAGIHRRDLTNAALAALLGKLPLIDHPGRRWAYSRATDVLGRLVEIWSGMTLGACLAERIFGPLGMADTGFHAPARPSSASRPGLRPRPRDEPARRAVRSSPRGGGGIGRWRARLDGGGLCALLADAARRRPASTAGASSAARRSNS